MLWRHQALTHGMTQDNERLMALGFTWMDSGKLYVLSFLLLIATMVGLQRGQRDRGSLGKSGLLVIAIFLLLAVGTATEFWGFPLGSYDFTFEEEMNNTWWLQFVSSFLLTAAFVPFGINLVRERVLPAWMVPVLVFGAATTVFLTPAFYFPGIVWMILGSMLLRHRRRAVGA